MKRNATLQHFFIALFSLAVMAGGAIPAHGQGTETFDNLELTGTSYADGSFEGQDGSTWTYIQCRGDHQITGKAIMIGRNRDPQSYVQSGSISGGIGVLTFDYMQAFSTNVNLNVMVNDAVVGNVTTSGEQGNVKSSGNITVEVEGDFVIKFINAENSDGQVVVDNISWTAPGDIPGSPPVIGNITRDPSAQISPETPVSVSAEITEGSAALDKVELRWGTTSGNHPNTINMNRGSGDTYTTEADIPAQSDGTTVFYIVYVEDTEGASDTSEEFSYYVADLNEWDGFETFGNLELSGTSYADGSFTGQDGSTWTYVQSRGDIEITGKALMLGRNRTPQAYLLSGTLSGGIGVIQFDYMQAFSTNVNLNVLVNDVVVGNVTSSGEPEVVKTSGDIVVNVEGPFELKFINANNGDGQVVIDNIKWTSYSGGGNAPPAITNITQIPAGDITSSTSVSVSADVIDTDGTVEKVELRWGTTAGNYTNTIGMNAGSGNTYTTASDIPAQTNGITVYYVIHAEDDAGDSSLSGERSYTVQDPLTTSLPYTNSFDTRLGEVYVYNASGASRTWVHRTASGNGYAEMNGFNTGDLEEDWLILPGINLNNHENVQMSFDTYWQYGEDDENNYLKLYYSTDYTGQGNTAAATWHELDFTTSSTAQVWTESGILDLSEINGDQVYIGFKYHYEEGKYRLWRIDNISVTSAAQPVLSAIPSFISQYTYESGQGPSDIYAFALSGSNLDGSDVSLSVPESFEIAFAADQVFGASLTLTAFNGEETSILSRMKAGLEAGSYEEQITISGGGADDIHVTLSGVVTEPAPPPPGLPYSQNFEGFVFDNGTEIPYFGTDQEWTFQSSGNQLIYQGDWGTGFSAGFRGNANLMGYQHTSSTGLFVATLTLENDTEETITSLDIAYTGKVERATEGRITEWIVMVNGTEVPALHYSTEDGVDKNISATVEGLNILPGEIITIGWGSERGGPSGSSRQIGITDVSVEVAETSDIVSATISPDTMEWEMGDPSAGEVIELSITWNDATELTQVVFFNPELDPEYENGEVIPEEAWSVTDNGDGTASFSMETGAKQLFTKENTETIVYVFRFYFDQGHPADLTITLTNVTWGVDFQVFNQETSAPVANALIVLSETVAGFPEEGLLTDENGLAVTDLPSGTYHVSISAEGYKSLNNQAIEVVRFPQHLENVINFMLVPGVDEQPDPIALPYFNPLRTEDDNAAALNDGFSIYEATQATAAGGYLRIFPDGYIQSPPVLLEELGELAIVFDATTFGGTTGQTLSVKVSDDGGNSFSTLESYEITGSYVTYETSIDPDAYTSESLLLRVEMTAGTNSTRLRDLHIYDPLAEYMVSFTVTDGESPIAGATITIGEDSRTTNAEGMAEFSLPNGTYTYAVTAEGYDDVADVQLTVSNDDVSETVVMTRSTYTITATAGDNGSIDPSGEVSVNHGDDQVFTVNPNENYHIAFIKVDGSDINLETDANWNAANRQYTFSNVTAHHSIEAGFAINTYTIEASAGDNGSIDPSGEVSVNHGDDQVFTVNPNEGYRIAFVAVDGTNINLGSDSNWNAGNRQYTFSNVTQNHTIEAGFEVDDTGLALPDLPGVKVYPNPVTDILYIESGDHITRLEIIDMTGRLVYREEPSVRQLSIDANALYNGIYFVRIITGSGMTTKRIQVAR